MNEHVFSFGDAERYEPVAGEMPFADGEPTGDTYQTMMSFDNSQPIRNRLVGSGKARPSKRWPGRLEPTTPRPLCVPHSTAHRLYAETLTAA